MKPALIAGAILAASASGLFAQEAPLVQGRLSASVETALRGDRVAAAAPAARTSRLMRQKAIRIIAIDRPPEGGMDAIDARRMDIQSGR